MPAQSEAAAVAANNATHPAADPPEAPAGSCAPQHDGLVGERWKRDPRVILYRSTRSGTVGVIDVEGVSPATDHVTYNKLVSAAFDECEAEDREKFLEWFMKPCD